MLSIRICDDSSKILHAKVQSKKEGKDQESTITIPDQDII